MKCDCLRRLLEINCPELDIEDDDIDKLVASGFTTENVTAGASRDDLLQVLPGRLGGVIGLVQSFGERPADKFTEFDWLCQDLPLWDSGRSRTTPSATHRERMYTPVSVQYWDVVKDIEVYLNKGDKSKHIYEKMHHSIFRTAMKQNLASIASSVLDCTCEFVSKKQPGSSVRFDWEVPLQLPPESLTEGGESTNSDGSKAENRDVQKSLFYARPPPADMIIESNCKAIAAIELKNGDLECPEHIFKLWTRCSCRTSSVWPDLIGFLVDSLFHDLSRMLSCQALLSWGLH